jgi:hypothetical protein
MNHAPIAYLVRFAVIVLREQAEPFEFERFRDPNEAQHVAAQLAMLGLAAQIEERRQRIEGESCRNPIAERLQQHRRKEEHGEDCRELEE